MENNMLTEIGFVTFKITFVSIIMDGNTAYGFGILQMIKVETECVLIWILAIDKHSIVGILISIVLFCGCHLTS